MDTPLDLSVNEHTDDDSGPLATEDSDVAILDEDDDTQTPPYGLNAVEDTPAEEGLLPDASIDVAEEDGEAISALDADDVDATPAAPWPATADEDDPEEILSESFLETPEEAAADAGMLDSLPPASTEPRSSRRRGPKPPEELSARGRRNRLIAKMLFWGLFFGLILGTALYATYKIPLIYPSVADETGRWPPWKYILGPVEVETVTHNVYRLNDGTELTQQEFDAIKDEVEPVIAEAGETYGRAKQLFNNAVEAGDREKAQEAIQQMEAMAEKLPPVIETLKKNQGPPRMNRNLRNAEDWEQRLLQDAVKWRRQAEGL